MKTTTETHLRVITPDTFSNIDYIHGGNKEDYTGPVLTKEHVNIAIKKFGNVPVDSEHFKYWEKQKAKCKIVRVTTIIEEDINSNFNYEAAPDLLEALDNIIYWIKETGSIQGSVLESKAKKAIKKAKNELSLSHKIDKAISEEGVMQLREKIEKIADNSNESIIEHQNNIIDYLEKSEKKVIVDDEIKEPHEPTLRERLINEAGVSPKNIKNHCTDLQVLYTPDIWAWLIMNYESYSIMTKKVADVDGSDWCGNMFIEIPFAYTEYHDTSKFRSIIDKAQDKEKESIFDLEKKFYKPSESLEYFDPETGNFYNRSGDKLRDPEEYNANSEGYTPFGDE